MKCSGSATLGQTDLLNRDQAVPDMYQLLAHVSHLMLPPVWCLSKETAASHTGQEERREVGQKNSLQEPPLPPAGKRSTEIKAATNKICCVNKKKKVTLSPSLLPHVVDHTCQKTRRSQGRFLLWSLPRSQSGRIDGKRRWITFHCSSRHRRSVQSHVRLPGLTDTWTVLKLHMYFYGPGLR